MQLRLPKRNKKQCIPKMNAKTLQLGTQTTNGN